MNVLTLFGQINRQQPGFDPNSVAAGGIGLMAAAVYLVIVVLIIASLWVIFTKAGKPGWAAIVPIYNGIVLLQIVGRPLWLIIAFFIPFVNFILSIVLAIDLAKSFGKSVLFAVGLIFLPFIFYPLLAFGDAKYRGPANAVTV